MTSKLIEDLLGEAPVILDGAWGTQLQKLGAPAGQYPDEWNLTHPELVEQVALAYVNAGSRIVLTNTFGANPLALAKQGLAERAAEINREGAAISKRAAADRALVFASMGPSGKLLMTGEVTGEELAKSFGLQAEALAEGGADAIVVETMSDPAEARLAVRAARAAGLPVVACMVFDSGRDKDRTMMGTTPEQAAAELLEAGADIAGANCGQGIEGYIPVARRLREASGRPVWIKPNAGLPELVDGEPVYRVTPEEFAARVPALIEAGAAFVGGCCGTNPAFVEAVRRAARPN